MLIEILARKPLKGYNVASGQFIPQDQLIYVKVNKRPVKNLSVIGVYRQGRVSVSWTDRNVRYVRFYENNPRIQTIYNKRLTKVRVRIEGKYERETMPT